MPFNYANSPHISDIVIIYPEIFHDERGFFLEEFKQSSFKKFGVDFEVKQWNHSNSIKNTIRGLHFQLDPPMAKIMSVTQGTAMMVAVDLRKDSLTFGEHFCIVSSPRYRNILYAPANFARGFSVLSDYAEVQYLCSAEYNPETESSINCFDPDLDIDWFINHNEAVLSEKDRRAQSWAQFKTTLI